MAEAAEETAKWTFGQIVATGVEATLFAIAIGIALWAGYWAKRAAIEGGRSVDATREIGKAQTRAYVQITKVTIIFEEQSIGIKKGLVPIISVEATNSGNSPAIRFRWSAKAVYMYSAARGNLRDGGVNIKTPNRWGDDIDKTLKIWHGFFPFILQRLDVNALKLGHLTMSVTIVSIFEDVFGSEISSEAHFTADFAEVDIGKEITMARTYVGAEDNAEMQSKMSEGLSAEPSVPSDEQEPNS